jgi:hypothetical protein
MSRNFVILAVAALVVCSFALAAGVAQATPLVINDPSFETWTSFGQAIYWNSIGPSGTASNGWTGFYDNVTYVPAIMNNTGNPYGYPTPPNGNNVAALRGTSTDHSSVLAQQLTTDGTTAFEFTSAGETVTMSIYAQSRSSAATFDIELWANGAPGTGTKIGDSGVIAVAQGGQNGPYTLESYTYTAASADVGKVLWMAFRDTATGGDDGDNLTLDVAAASYTGGTTTPEPSTLALLAAGLAGLLCYAWRKRR